MKPTKLTAMTITMALVFVTGPASWAGHIDQPQPHQITLAWDDNLEDNVVGYRLYYGNRSRQYPWYEELERGSSCQGGLCSAVLYLPNGRWFFGVTAVDTFSHESAFSEEVCAVLGAQPMPWLMLLLDD